MIVKCDRGIWINIRLRRRKGRNNISVKCPTWCKYRDKCKYGKRLGYKFRINIFDYERKGLLKFET